MRLLIALLLAVVLPALPASAEDPTPAQQTAPPAGVDDQAGAQAGEPEPAASAAPPRFRPEPGEALIRAFGSSDQHLSDRVRRTQTAAAERGLRDVEGAALAVLRDPGAGSELERALAAVALAPSLPAAHFGLASAHWRAGSPTDALGAAVRGAAAIPDHLLALLWAEVALWTVLARACLLAGLGFLAAAVAFSLIPAARTLPGGSGWPLASRMAAVGVLLLLPAALGEGVLGLVVGGLCVAMIPPGLTRRLAVLCAALLVWLALFPLLDRQGHATAALAADPVGRLAWRMGHGVLDRGGVQRLAHAASSDVEAAHAIAVQARRDGDVDEAARLFEPMLDAGDPRVRNNAANVMLARDEARQAIALYEEAARESLSLLLRVNLSQAYGTIVKLEQQDLALAEAQSIDARHAADLANVLSSAESGTTFDLPLSTAVAHQRTRSEQTRRDGAEIAAVSRRPFAAGRLSSPASAAAAIAMATAVGVAIAVLGDSPAARRRRRRKKRPVWDRIGGVLDTAASLLMPGFAGLRGARPLLALASVSLVAMAVAAAGLVRFAIPDPMALGAGVTWLGLGAACLAGLAYLGTTALSVALGERS
ncbi:MAG: hypothetical protein QNK05_04735 [Myxococcota bacterium]|nr:hypothetical protein [Myxococcota bacterium]